MRRLFTLCLWLACLVIAFLLIAENQKALLSFASSWEGRNATGPRQEALTNQVLVVLLDGLRQDTAQRMPHLEKYAKEGARGKVLSVLPTYSRPTMASILTGAIPEVHGVVTNDHNGPIRIDTLFSLAKVLGLSTAMVAEEETAAIYTNEIDHLAIVPPWKETKRQYDATLAKAKEQIISLAGKSLLMWVHFNDMDNIGHEVGGKSAAYEKEAAEVDRCLGELLSTWTKTFPNGAVLLISDHGHIDRGGHGGEEEMVTYTQMVWWGKSIRPGNLPLVPQTSLATTVCFLLGLPFPECAEHPFLASVPFSSEKLLAARSLDAYKQQSEWTQRFVQRIQNLCSTGSCLPQPSFQEDPLKNKEAEGQKNFSPAASKDSSTRHGLSSLEDLARQRFDAKNRYLRYPPDWQNEKRASLTSHLAGVLLILLVASIMPLFAKRKVFLFACLFAIFLFELLLWAIMMGVDGKITFSLIDEGNFYFLRRVGEALFLCFLFALGVFYLPIPEKKEATLALFAFLASGSFLPYLGIFLQYPPKSLLLPPLSLSLQAYFELFDILSISLAGCAVSLLLWKK